MDMTTKLTAAAERLFDRHGYMTTGMDRLTAAAGMSIRTLYKPARRQGTPKAAGAQAGGRACLSARQPRRATGAGAELRRIALLRRPP